MLKWSSFCLIMSLGLRVCGQTVNPTSHTNSIPVPALVEEKSGEIAYGLSANDFTIKDDGIEQQVRLEKDVEIRPLSLLLVIQTGHNAAAELNKIARLDDLLDSILTTPSDQVGIITFDSQPRLLQDFTTSSESISNALARIAAGNSGSALFDAAHTAMNTLRETPKENRRVILLISGERDHGSDASDAASLIRAVSSSDVSIYSLSFSASKRELLTRLWSLNPLAMTASAMQKNAAEALAQLTGGDFYHFDSETSFEDHVAEVSKHIHNRYSLAFRPSNPQPGFHSLEVEVRHVKANVVTPRSGYWCSQAGGGGDQ